MSQIPNIPTDIKWQPEPTSKWDFCFSSGLSQVELSSCQKWKSLPGLLCWLNYSCRLQIWESWTPRKLKSLRVCVCGSDCFLNIHLLVDVQWEHIAKRKATLSVQSHDQSSAQRRVTNTAGHTNTYQRRETEKIAGGIREHNHSLWGKISLHQTMRHVGIPKVTSVSSSEDEDIQASPEGEKTKQKNPMFTHAYTGELFSTIRPLGIQGQPVLPTVQYFTCQGHWNGRGQPRQESTGWAGTQAAEFKVGPGEHKPLQCTVDHFHTISW